LRILIPSSNLSRICPFHKTRDPKYPNSITSTKNGRIIGRESDFQGEAAIRAIAIKDRLWKTVGLSLNRKTVELCLKIKAKIWRYQEVPVSTMQAIMPKMIQNHP